MRYLCTPWEYSIIIIINTLLLHLQENIFPTLHNLSKNTLTDMYLKLSI